MTIRLQASWGRFGRHLIDIRSNIQTPIFTLENVKMGVYVIRIYSGESGIRTRDTLLAYTRFPGVPLQPLEHLSWGKYCFLVFSEVPEKRLQK